MTETRQSSEILRFHVVLKKHPRPDIGVSGILSGAWRGDSGGHASGARSTRDGCAVALPVDAELHGARLPRDAAML